MATRSRIARLLACLGACLLDASAAWGATPAVCTGSYHGMALRSDGQVFSWGNDYWGQLGSGRLLQRAAPGAVGDLQNVVAVAADEGFGMALLADGRVATWGWNDYGQRGDGSFIARGNDITMAQVTAVTMISAGTEFAAALRNDGRVWMWGQNAYTLGDGTNETRATPRLVEGVTDVVHVSAGWGHTIAVARDGSVWGWGDPGALFGAEVTSATFAEFGRPHRVPGVDGAKAASAGNGYTLVLREDGSVWAWGTNRDGQLGVSGITERATPAPVPGVTGIKAIAAGNYHALALRDDGSVVAWGANFDGQQGVGSTGDPLPAHTVPGLPGIAAISSGATHALALTPAGELWGWGANWRLQLGVTQSSLASPVRLPGLPAIQAMDAGGGFSLVVAGGRVLAWGENDFQQLASGPSPFVNRTSPGPVIGLAAPAAIACASSTSFALMPDGTLWAWGDNSTALLGRTPASHTTPAPVAGLPPLASVAASGTASHALAIDRDGRLWSWGSNYTGQLGNGSQMPAYPALVEGLPRIVAASPGSAHSLAIAADGSVWAWGLNDHGQLGDGTLVNRLRPVQVMGLPAVVAVSAGGSHSLALGSDGRVWAWGKALDGQLGIGAFRALDELAPVAVDSLGKAVAIAAGALHSFALLQDGSLWGWGINFFNVLGDESDVFRFNTPIRIRTDAPLTSIATASTHASAIGANGPIFAWGFNIEGQVGDGTYADRRAPVVVVGVGGVGFFNVSPEKPLSIPASKLPAFGVVASGSVTSDVVAQILFNAADIGASGNVYVFAWAPAASVKRLPGAKADPPAACVLAQLTSGGQLQQVSASSLQAYIAGVFSSQGQAVSVLGGAPAANIAGATFYVGYGSNAAQVLNGNNRSVVSIDATTCKPQPPQTGWWWNPAEPGRGFSIETSGNRIFFAAYMYDTGGRSTWYVASGTTGLDGSLFSGTLQGYANGQTLAGTYHAPSPAVSVGPMALAFSDASHGTLVMPGTQGPIPIERFNIVPNGLKAPVQVAQPESGWWWNETESGRGYYIEWQGGSAFLAGYMYDDAGQPLWYVSQSATPDARIFQGGWSQYGNGQVLGGAARAPVVVNGNVAPVAIQFQGADTAVLTLPGGRQSPIRRFRF